MAPQIYRYCDRGSSEWNPHEGDIARSRGEQERKNDGPGYERVKDILDDEVHRSIAFSQQLTS
jgi:hypothetical protein